MQLPTAMPMMFIASLILLISCANCSTESTTERPPSSSSDGKEKAPINPALNTVKKHIETARGVVVPAVKQSIDKYVLPNAKKAGDSAVRGWKAFRRFVRPVVNKAIGGGRAFGERLASMKHWESSGEEEKAEEKKKHEEKVKKREEKKAEKKKKKKNKKEHKTTVEKKEQKHEEKKENEAKKEEEELDESKKKHEEKKENEVKKEEEELGESKKEQEGHKEEATEVISEVKEKLNVEDIEKKRTELNNIEQQKDDELRKKKGKMVAVDTENDFEHEAKKEGTEWKMSLGPNDFDDEKTSSSSDSGSDESSK